MSASVASSAIYINDTAAQVKNKINRYAFSGGGDTAELHAQNGGNCEVDVAFQYLKFFLEDDEELADIEQKYTSGVLSTSQLKQRCIQVVQALVKQVQERRKLVTDEVLAVFMDATVTKLSDLNPAKTDVSVENLTLKE